MGTQETLTFVVRGTHWRSPSKCTTHEVLFDAVIGVSVTVEPFLNHLFSSIDFWLITSTHRAGSEAVKHTVLMRGSGWLLFPNWHSSSRSVSKGDFGTL